MTGEATLGHFSGVSLGLGEEVVPVGTRFSCIPFPTYKLGTCFGCRICKVQRHPDMCSLHFCSLRENVLQRNTIEFGGTRCVVCLLHLYR